MLMNRHRCRANGMCRVAVLAFACGVFPSVALAKPPASVATSRPVAPTVTPGATQARPVAPGVRVDLRGGEVEVDAEVVLREGFLELLACSPGTKEHESILRVRAKPSDIYRGIGMLGLPDGTPPRWDEKSQTAYPPRGTPVEVLVRWQRDGKTVEDDARDWMKRKDKDASLHSTRWYFIAAMPPAGERFAADIYGTVACVMQFGTAIVLLAPEGSIQPPTTQPAAASQPGSAARHAPSNPTQDGQYVDQPDDWALVPNASRVPPEGTKVVLVIRRTGRRLRATLDRFGRITLDGCEVERSGLDAALVASLSACETHERGALLELESGVLATDEATLSAALERAGFDPARIERRPLVGDFPENSPDAAAELLLHQFALHRSLGREIQAEVSRIAQRLATQRDTLEQTVMALDALSQGRATTTPASAPTK